MLFAPLISGRGTPSLLTTIIICLFSLCSTIRSVAAADKIAADYYVRSLPGQPEGDFLRQHAGHIEVNHEHNGNLFFWHYQNRHLADRPRTVIWLNGGPGCSSEDGALMEIGPYRIREGGKLEYNSGSWDQFANLLFVDNPVGTGFSYVDTDSYLHELQEMADQFILFLEKWFKIFPEYETDDLYLAGESYAGMHIPYIGRAIQKRNKNNIGGTQWNLKGLLIGNGWIAPIEQSQAYLSFAYAEGMIQGGTPQADKVEKQMSSCLKAVSQPGADTKINIGPCESVLTVLLEVTSKDKQCYNMYDIRLKDEYPACGMNWPPDLKTVTPYLQRKDVTEALHINPEKRVGWAECSGQVSNAFRASKSLPTVKFLPELIENDLPILLFSGAKDLICNHMGTEDFIANMKWKGVTGFGDAPRRNWTFDGEYAGFYQEARNLTYVLFKDSSHMVPFDFPERSLDMLNRFMGVDTSYLGTKPFDSVLEGEEAAKEEESDEEQKQKLRHAELKAYYRSGEAALVVVIIGAALFGLWVWRGRNRHSDTKGLGSYMTIPGVGVGERFRDSMHGHTNGSAGKSRARDVEAGDFDENELDTLPAGTRHGGTDTRDLSMDNSPYDLASDSDDDDEVKR